MDKNKFPNPELNLPKELRDSSDESVIKIFQAVECYLNLVGIYIYTEINLDHTPTDQNHIHAWIQRTVSANVLRSLYLRNAFVEEMNARNFVGLYLPLKAWFEVVGVLASILDLLESALPPKELYEKFQAYALGNRGKGNLRVGEIDAVNVATMIEKADKYITKIRQKNSDQKGKLVTDKFFTDFYDLASNPSHPSFDAYEVVGGLGDDGIWRVKTPDEVKSEIVETLPGYGGLLLAPLFVQSICEKIFEIEEHDFTRLGSKKYFE